MEKWYLVKKAFGEYKPGTEDEPVKVKLDPESSETKGLVTAGMIEETSAPEEDALEKVVETLSERLEKLAGGVVATVLGQASEKMGDKKSFSVMVGHERELDDPNEGYNDLGEFARDVHKSQNGTETTLVKRMGEYRELRMKKLKAATGQNESITEDGGILLPTQISATILRKVWEENDMLQRTRRFSVSGNSMDFKTLVEDSRQTGSRYGGVRAYWMDEAEQHTVSKAKWTNLSLKLHKLGAYVAVTDELMDDASMALDSFLSEMVGAEMGFVISDAVINGNGVGKPTGVLNSPALHTIAKETGQAADTILAENIDKMYQAMPVSSRRNSVWFVNADLEPSLQFLAYKVPITNVAGSENVGGGIIPLYVPPGGLTDRPFGTMKGRPVIPIEFCPGLGDEGDIIYSDMSQYLSIVKGGIKSASSIHLRFDYGETTFRFTFRVDGKPWWRKPVTPYKTTQSRLISPFVTLAERA